VKDSERCEHGQQWLCCTHCGERNRAEIVRDRDNHRAQLLALYRSGACILFADGKHGSLHPEGLEPSARYVGWHANQPTKGAK
jgi:hypothetical protein